MTALVTRFAPSPTGLLHLGNARTALLNFLAARRSGGRFILRVEDTDQARADERVMQELFTDLHWLGIDWDEGPDVGGPSTAYRQQQRRAIYESWLAKLDVAGLTYPCFCTPSALNAARKRQLAAGQIPRYAGTCRELTEAQRAERLVSGQPAALRFRVPSDELVEFDDLVHGPQCFRTEDVGDFIIRRADGGTAFFFSNAVDDALMGVTLVLRGDDHLTNTPRQLLVLEALGLPLPRYAHVALLLGMDGAPLSKRHGAASLHDLRKRGYLPGALRNHLVRLGHTCTTDGWLDEAAMRQDFDLGRLHRAPACFDETQLRHWQKVAVAQLSEQEFLEWVGAQLPPQVSAKRAAAFGRAVRPNVEFPSDAKLWADIVFGPLIQLAPDAVTAVRDAGEAFFATAATLFARVDMEFKQLTTELAAATGRTGQALFMPLRGALTGVTHGPELGPLLGLIPDGEVRARFERARRLAS